MEQSIYLTYRSTDPKVGLRCFSVTVGDDRKVVVMEVNPNEACGLSFDLVHVLGSVWANILDKGGDLDSCPTLHLGL